MWSFNLTNSLNRKLLWYVYVMITHESLITNNLIKPRRIEKSHKRVSKVCQTDFHPRTFFRFITWTGFDHAAKDLLTCFINPLTQIVSTLIQKSICFRNSLKIANNCIYLHMIKPQTNCYMFYTTNNTSNNTNSKANVARIKR